MTLAASCIAGSIPDRGRIRIDARWVGTVDIGGCKAIPRWVCRVCIAGNCTQPRVLSSMRVRWHLCDGKDYALRALFRPQGETAAFVQRAAAPEVRQREGRPAVATIGCAEKRKQRLVLNDGQDLAVALRPSARRKVETELPNFCEEWFRNISFPLVGMLVVLNTC